MSKCELNSLDLALDDAKSILTGKPEVLDPVYWHKAIKAYFIPGKRKNAMVLCGDGTWRSSTRYNTELQDPGLFIPLVQIAQIVEESAPF